MSALLSSAIRKALTTLPLLVCTGLLLIHFSAIRKYAVNIPFEDDWLMFAGDNHPASIDLHWLYTQQNEHRIATTKLLIWLQFQLNGWHYRDSLFLNLAIFGLLLICLVWFVRKVTHVVPVWAVLGFTIFLLSPFNWFNHFMALQVALHLYVLFFFISCGLLFHERQRFRELLLGCLTSVLGIYSQGGGFVSTTLLLGAFACFKALRIFRATGKGERRQELFQLLLVVGIVGSALAIWIIGYSKPPGHPVIVYLYTRNFWLFFLNLVSLGFGRERISTFWGIVCILIVLTPVLAEIWKRRGNLSGAHWTAYVAVFGVLADLASVSAGRAGFGVIAAKSYRYFEFAMPLILLSVANWAIFLRHQKGLSKVALVGLFCFCAAGFAHEWSFDMYRTHSVQRLEGARCVKAYYQGVGDGSCPTISSNAAWLDQAKRLNASFYREMRAETQQESNQR